MEFYDFTARKMNGQEVKVEEYKNKLTILIYL